MSFWMQALGAAASPLQPVPALDIEELLDERPWEHRSLDGDERRLLRGAFQFLEKVKRGGEIVKQLAETGSVIPDVVALDAYEYTRHALQSSVLFPEVSFEERQEIIEQAYQIIKTLIEDQNKSYDLSPDDTTPARRLFWTLAKYSHSRGSLLPIM